MADCPPCRGAPERQARQIPIGRRVAGVALALLAASCGRAPGERSRAPQIEVRTIDADHRLVRHAGGETIVPARPRRIAALAYEDEVLALGLQPAAFVTNWGTIRPYAATALAGSRPITTLYGPAEPPYEAVLAARPDLIIAGGYTVTRLAGLSAIAPTVVIETGDDDERRLREIGDLLDRHARAEAVIADYAARVRAARVLLAERVGRETVAVLRVRARKYQLFGTALVGPVLYRDLGLAAPALVQERLLSRNGGVMVLDPEQLYDLDVDHLFVVLNPQLTSDRSAAALEDLAAWRRVPAVARGHVYYVSQENWLARGLVARSVILDEAVAALLGEGRFAAALKTPAARREMAERVLRDPRPVLRNPPLLAPPEQPR